jgi:hypothetical protein
MRQNNFCGIWGSHNGKETEYEAAQSSGRSSLMFWKHTHCLRIQIFRIREQANMQGALSLCVMSLSTHFFLGCDTMWCRQSQAFCRSIYSCHVQGSARPRNRLKPSANSAELAIFFCWFLKWLTLWPWRWWLYVPLKHLALSKLCGITSRCSKSLTSSSVEYISVQAGSSAFCRFQLRGGFELVRVLYLPSVMWHHPQSQRACSYSFIWAMIHSTCFMEKTASQDVSLHTSVFPGICWDSISNRPWPLPTRAFPVCHSFVMLPVAAIYNLYK